jgi:transcriptional regulator with XRE-family HTH domain
MAIAQQERRATPPLRTIREARGLSLRETARRAGIDPAHLSKVERGEAGFSVENLRTLAGVLGLTELAKFLHPYARDSDE